MEPMATDSSWATSRRIQPIADTGTADYRPSLGSHRSLDTTPMHITNTHAPSPESRSGDAPALTTPPARPLETSWSVLVRAPPTSPTADLAREDDHRIGLHDTHEMGRSWCCDAPRFVLEAAPWSSTTHTGASSVAEQRSDRHGRRGARHQNRGLARFATIRAMTWQGFRMEKIGKGKGGEVS